MRERLVVSVVSLLIALGALTVVVWTVLSGAISTQGIDALFLIAIGLLIVLAFSPIPLQAIREGAFRGLFQRKRAAAAGPERVQPAVTAGKTPEAK
jgi:hypothetical protein